MNKKDISIATITLARNKDEETLLKKSLRRLAELDIPVFITDGGSNATFIHFLKSFSHFHVSEQTITGVWHQAKNSLGNACKSGSPFIFYTEPDKYEFFDQLPALIAEADADKHTGIILASRSEAGFASFPSFQQMTEETINKCCSEILIKVFDYTYGPFLLNKNLISYLQLVKEDIGWGWRPYIFGIAARLGFCIEALVKDFLCPASQQQDNPKERMHRIKQLSENIRGLILSTNVILTSDNSANFSSNGVGANNYSPKQE